MCFGRPTGLCGIRRIDNLLFLQKIRRTLTKHIVCLFIWINYCKGHICDFKSWWAKHPHPSVWCLFRRSKQLPRCLLVLLKEPDIATSFSVNHTVLSSSLLSPVRRNQNQEVAFHYFCEKCQGTTGLASEALQEHLGPSLHIMLLSKLLWKLSLQEIGLSDWQDVIKN